MLTAILTISILNGLIDVVDAHTYGAGEWEIFFALLAMGTGLGLKSDQPSRMVSRGILLASLPRFAQVAAVIATLGTVPTGGFAWYANRHLTPPPSELVVPTFNQSAPNWVENHQIGTFNWQLDHGISTTDLEGYAGTVSALPGEAVPIYISAVFGDALFLLRVSHRLVWGLGRQAL